MFSFRSGGSTAPPPATPPYLKPQEGPPSTPLPSSVHQTALQEKHHRPILAGHWFGAKRHHHQQKSAHSVDGEETNAETEGIKKLGHVRQWKLPGNRPRSVVFIEDHEIGSLRSIEIQRPLESGEEEEGEDYESDSEGGGTEVDGNTMQGKSQGPCDGIDSKVEGDFDKAADDREEKHDIPPKKKKRSRGSRSVVYVNDYGFIYDANSGQGTGDCHRNDKHELIQRHEHVSSTFSDMVAETTSTVVDHEREEMLKRRREYTQISERKWLYVLAHLQPDQVKKSTKVGRKSDAQTPIIACSFAYPCPFHLRCIVSRTSTRNLSELVFPIRYEAGFGNSSPMQTSFASQDSFKNSCSEATFRFMM